MYSLDRGSNSPQSPPMQSPPGGFSSAGLRPPKPPEFVHWFWLKGDCSRPVTSTFFEGGEAISRSISVPWPLSPYPSPGTVVKLYTEPSVCWFPHSHFV